MKPPLMLNPRRLPTFALVASLLVLAGCGPKMGTVSGTVTIDSQPLDKGVICFAPAEGSGEAVTGEVNDGHYSLRMAAGKKIVQLSAPIVVGKRKEYDGPEAPLIEITAERLGPRYNSESELTFDTPAGSSTKDWEVASQPVKQPQ